MTMGRPRWVPTREQRLLVEIYAAVGIQRGIIAEMMEVSVNTLTRACRKELDHGLQKANAKVAAKLFQKAMSGDSACMMFWMKTRAGWRETDRLGRLGFAEDGARAEPQFDFSLLTDEELAQLEGIRARLAHSGPDTIRAVATRG